MKLFKCLISLLLCAAVAAGCCASAGAMLAPLYYGDVDRSYDVNILDATHIQRYLAHLETPTELQEELADADGDGEMSVLDVTAIQRMLAGLPTAFAYRDLYDYYIGDVSFHSSAEISSPMAYYYDGGSEVCYVGVPVDFYCRERWGAQPRAYTLSINGETVMTAEADGYDPCVLTYTFTEEGVYSVTTEIRCQYDLSATYTREIKAVAMPADGSPVITGAVFYDASRMNSGNSELTVHAAGGTGEYEYSYELIPEEGSEAVFNTGFIKKNTVSIIELLSDAGITESWAGYPYTYIRVTARDSQGRLSEPVTASYSGYEVLA